MKTLIITKSLFIYLLILLYKPLCAKPGLAINETFHDSTACLEISGKVSFRKRPVDKTYKIELICYNTVIDSVTIKNKKEFKFLLNSHAYYTIKISKTGYVTRWVSICTDIEGPAYREIFYKFHFDTELIGDDEAQSLDADALEFPIAIISFDPKTGWFYYNEEYTANIKREIYKKTVALNRQTHKQFKK